jgi:hypothetical protein
MKMLVTTSDCKPTFLCLQAGKEDLFPSHRTFFEWMIQVASTGLYRASDGRRIHSDVNGSYNVLRKAFPNSFVIKSNNYQSIHSIRRQRKPASFNTIDF